MKIRSNIITREDVVRAVQSVPGVDFIDTNSREGWYVPVREFKPRNYARGFELFLSGTSKYNAAHQGYGWAYEKAATWDEWGRVMAYLFDIDPDAQIGWYKNAEAFERYTYEESQRVLRGFGPDTYYAKTHTAPWLTAA